MACGPRALLSHATAAFVWGIRDAEPGTLDVVLTGGNRRSKRDVRVHRVRGIDSSDTRRRNGLRLTSPARTLIDLAACVTAEELDELVARARVKGLIRPGELEAQLARAGRARGVGPMRAFLRREGEPAMTRSKAERIVRSLCRRARLPQPRMNVEVVGYEVDCLWEDEKLILEFDSYRFHGHRKAFEDDRRRDMVLADAGYEVIRITWHQLTEEPYVVIAHIARALGRRSATRR